MWGVVVQMLVFVETVVVETERMTKDVMTAVALLVVVQFELALLHRILPQWSYSGPSPLPAM